MYVTSCNLSILLRCVPCIPVLIVERLPTGLIAYSEATRYTPQKRLEAEAWCAQHHKRLGTHVLYPRTKGFISCVQQLRTAPHVKAVYDLTIAYARRSADNNTFVFQSPPTFLQSVSEPRLDEAFKFFVHVDRYALEDLPRGDEKLAGWLEERWVEKGERLEVLKRRLEAGLEWVDMDKVG